MKREIEQALRMAKESVFEEDLDEVKVILEQLLTRYPNDTNIMAELGVIYSKLHCDDEAEEILRAVLKKNPEHEYAVSVLGRLLDNSLRTSEAEQLFEEYLQRNEGSHCIVEDLCRLLVSEDRIDEAFTIATRHSNSYPDIFEAYDAIRFVLLQSENILESRAEENNYSAKFRVKLLENQLHQLDVFFTIEENVICENVEDDECIHDNIDRAYGDAMQVYQAICDQGVTLPDYLEQRIQTINSQMKSRNTLIDSR